MADYAQGRLNQFLDRLETAGNRLPHPTTLFIILCGVVLLLSAVCGETTLHAVHPVDGRIIPAVNLLDTAGIQRILTEMVDNFTGFAPLGVVLVAMLGIGVMEHSGLIAALLRRLVGGASSRMLTATVVFAGVLSSIAADAGYVVLVPLAGMLFANAGRNPLAGIAAAFAGVSGGFSANLLLGPVDAMLSSISTEAARIIDPDYRVELTANYWFMATSTLLITLIGTWVTEKLVLPRLPAWHGERETVTEEIPDSRAGLRAAGFTLAIGVTLLLCATVPIDGLLRNPQTGSLLRSPFIDGLVPILFLLAAASGLAYGVTAGTMRNDREFVQSMEKTMATMGTYLVLMFFAAQFVAWFSWSNLGVILAIKGAFFLSALEPDPVVLMVLFIFLIAALNLLIGSASAKWSLIAPIFVPMFLLAGVPAEMTQAAYRIGDSSTNIITPLMPYFGIVVAFVQRYEPEAGVGTIIALMLPFSICFLLAWSLLLAVWLTVGIPLGPGILPLP